MELRRHRKTPRNCPEEAAPGGCRVLGDTGGSPLRLKRPSVRREIVSLTEVTALGSPKNVLCAISNRCERCAAAWPGASRARRDCRSTKGFQPPRQQLPDGAAWPWSSAVLAALASPRERFCLEGGSCLPANGWCGAKLCLQRFSVPTCSGEHGTGVGTNEFTLVSVQGSSRACYHSLTTPSLTQTWPRDAIAGALLWHGWLHGVLAPAGSAQACSRCTPEHSQRCAKIKPR